MNVTALTRSIVLATEILCDLNKITDAGNVLLQEKGPVRHHESKRKFRKFLIYLKLGFTWKHI